ncbi:Predicted oxidoreductase [Microbacterium sp. LKL04]|uniref:Aldo/keto reductase n=1 Tax=Microbacterium oleivorans TaxID=273677 RepID=A0A4R5YJ87_9MICO|nr:MULTISPECIES: aldo/keto reductase [Microbacterium]MDQ1126894.1 aryl-alcohol dehydrogenase-like predicted oxidoreductase [Microbacterium sp. SORGH_AS_0505]TDL44978.1 aldo/keto reductase [Microbacterium oleivorans]SCY06964.1 Predicted oxidoreductase [Microbacterium sp. LKL04]
MAAFETADQASPTVVPGIHPSGPLPVHGAPVGRNIRVPLGETGFSVFPLVLGGAEFGWHVDLAAAHAILDRYVERGGNAVHTSDSYAAGRSEHAIGRWMAARRNRDDLVLTVKVGRGADNPGLGSVNLVRAVEASLTRLGTDRIDVLSLDGTADRTTLLEDTLATAEWLVDTGKVRAIGAAGYRAAQLVEARILSAAGYPRFTVLDVPYNVLRRDEFDGDLRLVAGAQGIAVTPSQALEHGYLSGVHRARDRVGGSVRGRQLAASMNRRGARTLRALDRIAAELAVPPAAVAIAWLLAQRVVAAPIVNAYAVAHVEELVQGVGVHLSRAHLAEIAKATD